MNLPTFQITKANNRLLFNYAASKLSPEESLMVKRMIESDDYWREYYNNMKGLYETYGASGLDIPMESESSYSSSENSNLKMTILTYRTQILDLSQEYRNALDKTSITEALLLDLIDIGEALANIPDFELVSIRKEYSNTVSHLIETINEIIISQTEFKQVELSMPVPDLDWLEKIMSYREVTVYQSFRTQIIKFLNARGISTGHKEVKKMPLNTQHELIEN